MAKKSNGARAKLRQHFLNNIGKKMDSYELWEIAGGITEWERRVRELRTEEGYQILTNNDRSDLKPGEYMLLDPKPQPAFERAISKETRAIVLDRNGFTCQMCGGPLPENSIHTILQEKHDCILGTSLTKVWVEQMILQI
ncbi:hypothetical protein FACS189494_11010 [Spirochaetia bacterium]|nr:hypothetical protein FACS189494_11010 [Spirochaetia bacterium]